MTSDNVNLPRAISYLRVSTKRQLDTAADIDPDGNSIATQREACQAKADKLGAYIEKEFVEPGTSAQTIDKRTVFKQLLAYLNENPGVEYVIIYMRSRAFRNLGDAVITKRRLEKLGIRLVSAKEDFGDGIMADAMEAVTDIINEVQVRMSGEDIRVKMQHKAQNGGTISRARIGYKNIRVEHDGRLVNTIGLDEERAPLIRMAWELYATGEYTIDRLYATMADQGLTTRASRRSPAQPLAASQLHRMLQDPYYLGLVVYKGDTFEGRHPAIVSQELFDKVQEVMEARSARGQRDRVHHHYLKGMLFCDRCHQAGRTSRMIYTQAKGRRGDCHEYYFCRARQDKLCDLPYLPVHIVEQAVIDLYPHLALDTDFASVLREEIDTTLADERSTVQELHDNYRKQLKKLDVQEERLLDLAADSDMPRERIKERLRRIRADREQAEAGLNETGAKLVIGAETLRMLIQLLNDPAKLYEQVIDSTRRKLNDAILERIYVNEDGVGTFVTTEPITELHDAQDAWFTSEQLRRASVIYRRAAPVGRVQRPV